MGFAEAFHGGVSHDGGDAVGGEDFAVLFGGEEAGDEDVDPDVVGGPLAGEIFGEVVHGRLAGGVGEDAGEGDDAGHGAEVDDGAAFASLNEVAAENLAAEEDALVIDGEDAVALLLGDVEDGGGGVDAGSVDDDVHPAGAGEDGGEEGFEAGLGAGFGGLEPGIAAGSGDGVEAGFGFFFVAADEDDFGSGGGEAFGHGAAEFAGATDDDGDLALEGEKGGEVFGRLHEGLKVKGAEGVNSPGVVN